MAKQQKQPLEEYIPIQKIENNRVYMKDESIIGYMYVYPKDINLMKDSQKELVIKSYGNIYKSLSEDLQTINIASATKIDACVNYLQQLRQDEDNLMKRKILAQDIEYVIEQSKNTVERNAYIMVKEKSEKTLVERLKNLGSQLNTVGLQVRICKDEEIKQLLVSYYNPDYTGKIQEVYYDI